MQRQRPAAIEQKLWLHPRRPASATRARALRPLPHGPASSSAAGCARTTTSPAPARCTISGSPSAASTRRDGPRPASAPLRPRARPTPPAAAHVRLRRGHLRLPVPRPDRLAASCAPCTATSDGYGLRGHHPASLPRTSSGCRARVRHGRLPRAPLSFAIAASGCVTTRVPHHPAAAPRARRRRPPLLQRPAPPRSSPAASSHAAHHGGRRLAPMPASLAGAPQHPAPLRAPSPPAAAPRLQLKRRPRRRLRLWLPRLVIDVSVGPLLRCVRR